MTNNTKTAQTLYDSIENEARRVHLPGSPNISPRLIMGVLAVIGGLGIALGSADLKLDPMITFKTSLGERTQPYWIVPKGAEIVKAEGSSGALRGFGWLAGAIAFGGLWHVAGKDLKWQKFVGDIQTTAHITAKKQRKASDEMESMAALSRQHDRLEMENNLEAAQINYDFHQAIGYTPDATRFQYALPYGDPGTLDDLTDPSTKVTESKKSKQIDKEKSSPIVGTDYILPPLTAFPVALVFGAAGSGKTTFVKKIAEGKLNAKHRVEVLDPHYSLGSWKGCTVYGKGFNYAEIDLRLIAFCQEVTRRYKRVAEEDNPVFEPFSIICDEFTMWGSRCDGAADFLLQCLTDIRKVKCYATICGHTNTITGLGGKKSAGIATLIKTAMLEIEIIGQQNPISGEAEPAYQLRCKLPGMVRKNAFAVKYQPDTESNEPGNSDPSLSLLMADLPEPEVELEDYWAADTKTQSPERGSGRVQPSPTNDRSEPLQGPEFSQLEVVYGLKHLTKDEMVSAIRESLRTRNKGDTIFELWGCKKGGSSEYVKANREFNELAGDATETADWLGF